MKEIFSDQSTLQPGWFSYDDSKYGVIKESIDTPLIRQSEKSYHCGQALAGMFLNFKHKQMILNFTDVILEKTMKEIATQSWKFMELLIGTKIKKQEHSGLYSIR